MDQRIHDALVNYTRDLYAGEDAVLQAVHLEADEHGLPRIHIRPEEGRVLQFLTRLAGVKTMVEIGTLAGYSGLWLARALPEDGRLITLEQNPEHAEVARHTFERAGLAGRVEVRLGAALDLLRDLTQEGPFDAVFIDADKGSYPEYLTWAIENIRPGGLIMAHNAFLHGAVIGMRERNARDINAVQTFNRRLADDVRLLGTIIPVGDGIAAAIRL